jgi:hypothetical protein
LHSARLLRGFGRLHFQSSARAFLVHTASGGSITAPGFGNGDPKVSVRSSALGDPSAAGESRYYMVY